MSLKSTLRPLHLRLRTNTVYEGLYLLFRPKARKALKNAAERGNAAVASAKAKNTTKAKAIPKMTAVEKQDIASLGKLEVVSMLMDAGDYSVANKVLEGLRENTSLSTNRDLWKMQAKLLLAQADHEGLLETTKDMIERLDMPVGHYYAAQSYFARGLYEKTMHHIQACLLASPHNADCVYLLCDLAQRTGQPEMARQALERLVLVSRRVKSWLTLANLVETDNDYLRMQDAWVKWTKVLLKGGYNKDTHEYLALGAMRIGNYDLAKEIWRGSLKKAAKRADGFQSLNVRKPSYSSSRAEDTLSDLNTTLRAASIEMFLVSGTLLGCVRENKLLGHDKDIDVGIWSDVSAEDFFNVIYGSGQFMILASRSEHIIRLKHLNGIAVDIFFHYRDPKDYWHAGVKMKWHNTPFKLVEREFLGQTHLIPEDYDTYLTENYGDWKTPKIAFDSAFDTPNGEVLHEDEMIIHAMKGLQNACISGTPGAPNIYLDDLVARGEGAFVESFRAHLEEVDPATFALLSPQEGVESTEGSIDAT